MRYGALITIKSWYIEYLSEYVSKNKVKDTKFYEEFLSNTTFVYLGEIAQMPGHIICAGKNGKVYFGFHAEDFRELTDEEA